VRRTCVDELATKMEAYEPKPEDDRPVAPWHALQRAVQERARIEAEIAKAVHDMRSARYSWASIGAVLGTAGESARQRYGRSEAAVAND
jgi:hypothetical protein